MSRRSAEPTVPPERRESIRRDLASLLEEGDFTARDLSKRLRIPEKSVHDHLDHIRLSLPPRGLTLKVDPAGCLDCGFVFRKRDRLTTPGRCPMCRGEAIEPPLFSVVPLKGKVPDRNEV